MRFSLFFFDGDGSNEATDRYRLLMDSARFADEHEFDAVWTPERHFHAFGGLYPNPALTSAALAMITQAVQLRAGSLVLPLHHPVRVAEDWSVIDNLSQGRAALAVASGWTMDEFVLSRDPHGARRRLMWRSLEQIRKLWRGESVKFEDAGGREVDVKTLPKPIQKELPIWVTCQSTETFLEAGRLGFNVLTSLLAGTLDDVVERVARYREALESNGYDPYEYRVSLMLHTFLGDNEDQVKQDIREPFCEYLKTHYGLLETFAQAMGLEISLDDFSDDDLESLLNFGVEGFMQQRSLIGTPDGCAPFVRELEEKGIDEICCLIDFLQDYDSVMGALPHLGELKRLCGGKKSPVRESNVVSV
ncbi:MAG: LLM class flavin-dependent oxidoreductase [Pseudomonadota bacterium]